MIWAKEETLPREEMEALQTARLKETVERVYHTVAPYRKKMDEAGIKPEDIRGLEDLHNLPFVTKQDMRDNYPFGLFAVPKEKLYSCVKRNDRKTDSRRIHKERSGCVVRLCM